MTHPDHPDSLLTVSSVSMHYGNRSALADVSFSVSPGEVIGLLGPNGSGKSTLLKIVSGMVMPSHGEVLFSGQVLTHPVQGITYVPQRSGADWNFPITVLESVMLAFGRKSSRFRPYSRAEKAAALAALAKVNMEKFSHVQIGALSGGQQQRVFLARALLACGRVLLLDEPFTGVDIPTQELFIDLFDDLARGGTAIIYATHDLQQARERANRVILLNRRLIANGPAADVFTGDLVRQAFGGSVFIINEPTSDQGSQA
jgi:ABC-type Mn2+/Zn2+ transport system ATPase subunit